MVFDKIIRVGLSTENDLHSMGNCCVSSKGEGAGAHGAVRDSTSMIFIGNGSEMMLSDLAPQDKIEGAEMMEITVLKASGLKECNTLSRNDPFVRIEMDAHKRRTASKKGNDPEFNEACRFFVHPLSSYEVDVSVWDADTFSADDLIGKGSFPLSVLALCAPKSGNMDPDIGIKLTLYDTAQQAVGFVHLKVRIVPQTTMKRIFWRSFAHIVGVYRISHAHKYRPMLYLPCSRISLIPPYPTYFVAHHLTQGVWKIHCFMRGRNLGWET